MNDCNVFVYFRCLNVRCQPLLNQRGMVVRHMCSSKTDDSDSATPQKPGGGQKLDLAKPKARRRAEHVQTSSEAKYIEFIILEQHVECICGVLFYK